MKKNTNKIYLRIQGTCGEEDLSLSNNDARQLAKILEKYTAAVSKACGKDTLLSLKLEEGSILIGLSLIHTFMNDGELFRNLEDKSKKELKSLSQIALQNNYKMDVVTQSRTKAIAEMSDAEDRKNVFYDSEKYLYGKITKVATNPPTIQIATEDNIRIEVRTSIKIVLGIEKNMFCGEYELLVSCKEDLYGDIEEGSYKLKELKEIRTLGQEEKQRIWEQAAKHWKDVHVEEFMSELRG